MARVKVRLADNIARVVFIDPNATRGATFGADIYLPDGNIATPATLREYLGLSTGTSSSGGSSGSAAGTLHSTLSGLSANDHPQYALAASLATVATSGAYSDLSGTPFVPSLLDDLTDVDTYGAQDGDALVYDSASETWVPGVVSGGSGGASSMQFVGEAVVAGTAATDLTLSGLNIDVDERYELEIAVLGATGSTASLSLFLNSDTTATNYEAARLTDGASAKSDDAIFGGSVGARIGRIMCTLTRGVDGRAIMEFRGARAESTTATLQDAIVIWDTSANVTSVTLNSSVASHLAVGSYIRAWKVTREVASGSVTTLHNVATSASAAGFATDTYVTGSAISVPNNKIQAGTRYRLRLHIVKTAAGVAAPVFTVRFGTAGTTADASIVSLTFPAQTASIDAGVFEAEVVFRSAGSGTSAVAHMSARLTHDASTTGLANSGFAVHRQTAGSGFDSTISGSVVGVSVNAGTSAAWTIHQANATLENLLP